MLKTIAIKDFKFWDKWEKAKPGSLLQIRRNAESVIALRFETEDKKSYLLVLTGNSRRTVIPSDGAPALDVTDLTELFLSDPSPIPFQEYKDQKGLVLVYAAASAATTCFLRAGHIAVLLDGKTMQHPPEDEILVVGTLDVGPKKT